MGIPSKPMAKNSNSRFTTRNNKQDIFSKMTQTSKTKPEIRTKSTDDCKENENQSK